MILGECGIGGKRVRYVFIANPAAGKNNPAKGILAQIQEYCAGTGRHCRYEETRGIGDALRIVREEATKEEPLRVYAQLDWTPPWPMRW